MAEGVKHDHAGVEEVFLADGFLFRWLPNGDAIWKHPACRSWAHIDLTTGQHHQVMSKEPVTLIPSLLCPMGCGTHGYIRSGRWVQA